MTSIFAICFGCLLINRGAYSLPDDVARRGITRRAALALTIVLAMSGASMLVRGSFGESLTRGGSHWTTQICYAHSAGSFFRDYSTCVRCRRCPIRYTVRKPHGNRSGGRI